jgi:hypothetical protein
MGQTFDIRFARSSGIAALFDATGNSLGWKGGGRLSIDAQGISFALKRGVASLLARRRSQRIPAKNIREVYREGNALRVEFASNDDARVVLPFWARDRDTASQIVRLLPTLRTFEVENGPTETRQKKTRVRWVGPVAVLAVLAGLAAAVFMLSMKQSTVNVENQIVVLPVPIEVPVAAKTTDQTTDTPPALPATEDRVTPDEARKLAMLAEDPVDWTSPPPRSNQTNAESIERRQRLERAMESLPAPESGSEAEAFVPDDIPEIEPRPEQLVVRIPQTTLAYGTARDLLSAFEAGARDLINGYQEQRRHFDAGTLDRAKFADLLDRYALRWRNLNERLLESRKFSDPVLTGLRGTLATVVIQQRVFLTGYAEGLRTRDQPRIDRAFAELARADEALARARLYLN